MKATTKIKTTGIRNDKIKLTRDQIKTTTTPKLKSIKGAKTKNKAKAKNPFKAPIRIIYSR